MQRRRPGGEGHAFYRRLGVVRPSYGPKLEERIRDYEKLAQRTWARHKYHGWVGDYPRYEVIETQV